MMCVFTLGFLALSMACSYKEEYYVNDDTCSGEPTETNLVERYKEDKCIKSEGVFGIITKCTYARLDWALYEDDSRCRGKPVDKWSYINGQCTYQFNYDGERMYTKITMIEEIEAVDESEDEKAVQMVTLWSTLIFVSMVVVNM